MNIGLNHGIKMIFNFEDEHDKIAFYAFLLLIIYNIYK